MPVRRLVYAAARVAARLAPRAARRAWSLARAAWGRVFGPRRPLTADALGRRGERAAEKALRRRGYRILARRLRTRGGEADLVAVDGETVVLVEVKASVAQSGAAAPLRTPAERVDGRKRRRLAGASASLRRGDLSRRPHRIDVVAVVFRGRSADVTVLRGAARATRAPGGGDRG